MKKVKLTSVCRPKQWKSIPISELSDVGYPVYGANGVIGYYDSYNHEQETVIITCRGATCGTVNLTHPRSYVTGNAMCLDNVKDSVDIKYLFYSMQAYDFTKVISGTAQPQITRVGLEKVEITLPSLDVQREIVSILDKIDALIEQRRLQLKKLEELVKARFVEMFGDTFSNPKRWPTKTFREASLRLSDGPFGSNLKSEHYSENGVRVIRLGNIGVGKFIDKDQSYVSLDHYEHLKKYTCKPGEIVIGTLGEPNLRACIIPDYVKLAVNKADCVHYVPDSKILENTFVCQYINCPTTLLLASNMVHGQTRARVSSGQIAKMPIFIPPLSLQKQFAAFVAAIDKSKATVQKALDETQLLFDSLMQQYFG